MPEKDSRSNASASIVEAFVDPTLVRDLDGTILSWNTAAKELYGYSSDEMIGRSIFLLVPPEKMDEIIESIHLVRSGAPVRQLDTVRLKKDGTRVDVSLVVLPIKDASGAVARVSVTARSTTDTRYMEHGLKMGTRLIEDLYDNAPCGYHSIDRNGVIVHINNTELKWLGYGREEVVGRKKVIDLLPPEGKELFRENFPRFMETGFVRDLRFDFIRKDGTLLPVLLSATAIRDHEGRFLMSRSVLYDLTEHKKAEDEMIRLNKELADALARAQKVLAGVLHICASCKKIRNEQGVWNTVEAYIRDRSEVEFTHTVCDDCAKKLYPELYEKKK